ncbi:hypothetical protein Misp01_75390 [Microtetraspora sp. NBRC 13810]|uniref:STAS domain-containing protein n=1 Tax=Microtetraspora sp. NBRC 13810 TaxID=3030990 RepID=UPI0024A2D3A1|nr:STAS domain-containing protein [Microtetraspora sp. NBRC 13810]GLW12411.1 hypothetical protein Misp01_75390 [Microtetraspora sp. NBRC 13810]
MDVEFGVEFDNGLLRIVRLAEPYGLRVEGDVDSSTVTAFVAALQRVTSGHEARVYADLGRVEFIDVAGLRALVSVAGRLGRGRELVLRPVPPHIRHLLVLIGWDVVPGLRLEQDGDGERVRRPA